MPTTFTTGVPYDGQSLGNSKSLVRNNFTNYKENMEINHASIGSADFGKHKYLQMPETTIPDTAVDEAGFYSKVGAGAVAETNLWFRAENNGKEYQLTTSYDSKKGTFATSTGWTFLPGGLMLQYGSVSAATSTTITFPVPFTALPYSLTVNREMDSAGSNHAAIKKDSVTTAQFVILTGSSSNRKVYWTAIGTV